eukprot:4824308-Amphidinium_carterae.2
MDPPSTPTRHLPIFSLCASNPVSTGSCELGSGGRIHSEMSSHHQTQQARNAHCPFAVQMNSKLNKTSTVVAVA